MNISHSNQSLVFNLQQFHLRILSIQKYCKVKRQVFVRTYKRHRLSVLCDVSHLHFLCLFPVLYWNLVVCLIVADISCLFLMISFISNIRTTSIIGKSAILHHIVDWRTSNREVGRQLADSEHKLRVGGVNNFESSFVAWVLEVFSQ